MALHEQAKSSTVMRIYPDLHKRLTKFIDITNKQDGFNLLRSPNNPQTISKELASSYEAKIRLLQAERDTLVRDNKQTVSEKDEEIRNLKALLQKALADNSGLKKESVCKDALIEKLEGLLKKTVILVREGGQTITTMLREIENLQSLIKRSEDHIKVLENKLNESTKADNVNKQASTSNNREPLLGWLHPNRTTNSQASGHNIPSGSFNQGDSPCSDKDGFSDIPLNNK